MERGFAPFTHEHREEMPMAKYNCKTCGAELYFDPVIGKLLCEYCGSAFEPSEYAYDPEAGGA